MANLSLHSNVHEIFKIVDVIILPFSQNDEQFQNEMELNSNNSQNSINKSNNLFNNLMTSLSKTSLSKNTNLNTKFEKSILDEIKKIFSENEGSFYFSNTLDLTNNVEVQNLSGYDRAKEVWQRADNRFFWNYSLVTCLFELKCHESFIQPIIQGYIQADLIKIRLPILIKNNISTIDNRKINFTLISRRNRFQLGTRFRKRGVDDDGNVANFVETEQIIEYEGHVLSFVLLRGSIPLYWRQPGIKYRPAPRLYKGKL